MVSFFKYIKIPKLSFWYENNIVMPRLKGNKKALTETQTLRTSYSKAVANRQDWLQYTAPQLAWSVIRWVRTFLAYSVTQLSHTVHVVNTVCSPWAEMFCLISRHARVHDFVRCILHVPRSQLRRVHHFLQEMMYKFCFNVYYHSYCSVHCIHTCYVRGDYSQGTSICDSPLVSVIDLL